MGRLQASKVDNACHVGPRNYARGASLHSIALPSRTRRSSQGVEMLQPRSA